MIFTPILPEIMDSVYEKTGLIEGEDEDVDIIIADKASGLYFACFALGTIVAPPVGSVIYELLHEDWAYTCDVIGVTAAIFTVVYLLFNLLPDLKKEREGHEKMEENIINSKIIQQKMGLIDDVDHEDTAGSSHRVVEVPQSLWMKKEEKKLAKLGTEEHRLSG